MAHASNGPRPDTPPLRSDPPAAATGAAPTEFKHSFSSLILGTERKMRIRLRQSMLVLAVYTVGSVTVYGLAQGGAMPPWLANLWLAWMATGQIVVYTLIRSGWSTRLKDPAMTEVQMLLAITNACCCYAISGIGRSAMLYPLLLTFTFGAFSLHWRRIALLTVVALTMTAITMFALHRFGPPGLDPAVDLSNFAVAAIILPAISFVSVTLGRMRRKMSDQRAELVEALERIQRLASHDSLTGLVNRRHAETLVEAEVSRAVRGRTAFCVALLDLDHFKSINDRYGHAGGDDVLRGFAEAARESLRMYDTVARWGGEEFLVILPDTVGSTARVALERVRAAVARTEIEAGTHRITVTVSGGVAQYRAGESPGDLIARADAALYVAKTAGRDRIEGGDGHVAPALRLREPIVQPDFGGTRPGPGGARGLSPTNGAIDHPQDW